MFRGGKRLTLALIACAAVLVVGAAPSVALSPVPQKPHYRVMGGGQADFAQWPFGAAILYKGKFLCSGSAIDSRHVITAGHCGRGFKAAQLSVITGRADLRQGSVGQVIPVSAVFVDPTSRKRHDISVFGLAAPTTSPAIPLASVEENAAATIRGAGLRVAGWGATTPFQDKLPGFLKTTTVTSLPGKPCFRAYGKVFKSVPMVCAQGARLKPNDKFSGRTGPCAGDSGGPLVSDTPAGPRLIAVVSFGPRFCGDPFAPVVYARVSDDLAFIATAVATPLP